MGWDAHRLELNPKGAIITQIRIILYALATGSVWQAPHKPQRAFEKIRGLICAATQPDKCKEIAENRIENARVEKDGMLKAEAAKNFAGAPVTNPHLLLLGFCRFAINVQSGALTCAA